jgi:hypothetical protein
VLSGRITDDARGDDGGVRDDGDGGDAANDDGGAGGSAVVPNIGENDRTAGSERNDPSD